jgi:hypothetical protein
MLDATHRVQAILDRFVAELTQVAREEATRMVLAGFGAPTSNRRAVANGSATMASSARTVSPPKRTRASGVKRSPEDLQALQDRVHDFIAAHPGLRIEQINKQLGTRTNELALPLRKLIAAKLVRTSGHRRSTTYVASARTAPTRAKSAVPNGKRSGRTSKRRRRSTR